MDSSVRALRRSLAVDATIIVLIFCLLTWLASKSIDAGRDFAIAMMAPGGIILIGFATGLYGRRLHSNAQLLSRGFLAISLCFAVGTAGALLIDMGDDLQFALLIAAPLSGALMILVRAAQRSITETGDATRHLFIIAPEPVLGQVLRQCQGAAGRFKIAGGVAPDCQGRLLPTDILRIEAFIGDRGPDRTVVVSGTLLADERLAGAMLRCLDGGGRVETAAEFMADNFGRLPNDDPESLQRLLMSEAKPRRLQRVVERAIDIAVVLVLLVLCAPLMVLVALVIHWQDGGPILYRQVRVGLNGRPFTLLKFRSMRIDAESDGAQWAKKDDARATPFGAILRAHRLDELPQLFNVLRNEMSIVGPRPERPEMVESLRREIALYDHRHRVRPGLTGWAQINFPYGATIEEAAEKTRYDLYYVQYRSPLLNLLVLLQTMRVVIFAEGSR